MKHTRCVQKVSNRLKYSKLFIEVVSRSKTQKLLKKEKNHIYRIVKLKKHTASCMDICIK